MNIDPKQMAQVAQQARHDQRELECEEARELARLRKEVGERYDEIIAGAEAQIVAAARDGKNQVVIMKVMHGIQYHGPVEYREMDGPFPKYGENGSRDRLMPGPKRVYDYLESGNFNPTLIFEHDGVGENSWWELRANW